ncbi:hypothetical protein GTQ34_08055 [Muricauda sp. JGD-17]|uniref:Uncharacterized protein n=1 Tax=Flagellimonas ochracea TaxID=2696472 RepID=A0A964WXH4_9FLAO|nr:hypothetical protein [Allomuricauda ochracea]NAY91867.1 hypothetical protein [Allomuricauda ochracea]
MKRVIVDYKKLDGVILNLLVEKYPDGYGDGDIISFRNSQGEWVECIEVRTKDTVYLVKVSKRLTMAMEDYEISADKEDDITLDYSEQNLEKE